MRLSNIFYVLARLCLLQGCALLVPLAFAVYYNDGMILIFSALAAGLFLLSLTTKLYRELPSELTIREGFLIVTLSWLVLALFGSIPFVASGYISGYIDAFFETMSGFTTTGATILTNIERLPKSLLVWRNMTQWLGGMGVIALAVAIFPFLGVGATQLFKAEVPGPTKDKISPRISETAKILWWVYVAFTAAETCLLMAGGLNFFESLCVAFGTMATGGFAPLDSSIAGYSPYIQYTVAFFMLMAGINFNLHYWALKGKPSYYIKNSEFRFFLSIIAISFVFIVVTRLVSGSNLSEELLRSSIFQIVSIITTTGFITADYELWPFVTQFVLLLLMLVGGSSSSTGGGIKNIRVLILFKQIGSEFKKSIRPRGVFPIKVGDKTVSEGIVSNAVAFIVLYGMISLGGVVIMTMLGLDIDSAIGSVAATIGNVGPGIGSVGPIKNYSHIPDAGKLTLSFLMLVGRLEIYTVLLIFFPRFWK
ncbi:MAG: TrkH family potassium uptake protein [Syntrophorhabdaceae bacterium]|nr:TrkH family potassium uptake protein [Syntrophorhabdaceae bacterium]MDD5243885.1 TrkH family potassium uptake protein [Syntrophorhabdaceae bacterium]